MRAAASARPFHDVEVIALGPLELLDDLAALGEETSCFLSAGEKERAESKLSAEPPRTDQIAIRDQAAERE